ncbi:hypothetical protein [Aquimarina celericrescens]|uniref:Uncharacterized protein n=1 Tax=Aquimarina celericrescens TaxID=1964542 RepID=A0ABW5AY10_9FLAO|nr:hypothetical protein [Aquimarina celericrescens]
MNTQKFWYLGLIFIADEDQHLIDVFITFPDDALKGEPLYFEGEFSINGTMIPRIRHWREYSDNQYSGSDIIVKEL